MGGLSSEAAATSTDVVVSTCAENAKCDTEEEGGEAPEIEDISVNKGHKNNNESIKYNEEGTARNSETTASADTTVPTLLKETTATAVSKESESPSPAASEPPLCRHWAKMKRCLYYSKGKCKFSHPESTIPKYSCENNGTTANTAQQGDGICGVKLPRHRTPSGRLQTRNDARVAQFRNFIAQKLKQAAAVKKTMRSAHSTLEVENEQQQPDDWEEERGGLEGHRVLDVAGGKGELAYQLIHLCGVESCHVVDPRALSLRRFRTRRQRGHYHRSMFLHPEIVTPREKEEVDVGHLRCLFTEELWMISNPATDDARNEDDDDDGAEKQQETPEVSFQENNARATEAWEWPPPTKNGKSTKDQHHGGGEDRDDPNSTKTPFPTYDYASSITQNATLIVGMHPDQAVDAIVDAALVLNVSFFVVPCCTYSAEFPHRKVLIPGGSGEEKKVVKTYDELLDYLQAKSDDIQRAELHFEGKNICLYRVVT